MAGLTAWLERPVVVRSAQILIGLVFLVAGLAKIGDLGSFAGQIHNFRMMPVWSENILAMTLPWIEVVAAMCLILGHRARAAGVFAAALMFVFIVAVAQASLRDLDIECGCFGTADATKVGLKKLLENTGLFFLAVISTLPWNRDA